MSSSISKHFKPYFHTKMKYKGGSSGTPRPGTTIYKMSSNENPLGSSPLIAPHLKQCTRDLHLYPDTTDIRLREVLEDHYNSRISKDQFVTANSGSEIIQLLIKGMIDIGDEVIVSSPFFVPYRTFTEWAGGVVIDVPLRPVSYELDIEGIKAAISNRTRIIFITSPNNPSGTYVRRDLLEEALAQIPSDIIVLYDEVYHHFVDAPDYARALDLLEYYPNIVGLNSFSKAYGLAALRVGYMYGSLELTEYIRLIQRPFLLNKLSMEAAMIALHDEDFLDRVVRHVHNELPYLQKELDRLEITYVPSSANFIMFLPPIDAPTFVNEMSEQGVILRPLDNYMAPGWVRVSINERKGNERFIEVLEGICNKAAL